MKPQKLFTAILAFGMVFSSIGSLTANAADSQTQTANTTEDERATGLISGYFLSISASSGAIKINSETICSDIMAEIGFTHIKVQYSSNGTSGWTEEKTLNPDTITNASYHNKVNESVPVNGGYYYRVVLDHYAKETGWWFPSSQSITNYSNVVWVSA
jgi:hypothetical protein